MFRPVAAFIGLRYTRAKRRNRFISFISSSSMIGIALGVLVLITVLSVMNGFDREIKKRVFGMVAPITVSNHDEVLHDWQSLKQMLSTYPAVTAVAPFANSEALLTSDHAVQPALISGIDPQAESALSALADKMIVGQLSSLSPHTFGIVLGEDLANRLGVSLGDKVMLITAQMTMTPAGAIPRYKRFTVTGVYRAGGGFGFDMAYGFINLVDGQILFQLGDAVSGLHVSLKSFDQAPALSHSIANKIGEDFHVTDWTDQFGAYFHAVKLEKTMMFFILLLIIAVAVFNLVSTLTMVVNDKQSDIAILRTFGASPQTIMMIFVVQGAIVGLVGTLLGVIGGVMLALNATAIEQWIERLFHIQLFSANVYFVDYLPSECRLGDVLKISFASLALSLIATLYPAYRASKIEPVEALRYE